MTSSPLAVVKASTPKFSPYNAGAVDTLLTLSIHQTHTHTQSMSAKSADHNIQGGAWVLAWVAVGGGASGIHQMALEKLKIHTHTHPGVKE